MKVIFDNNISPAIARALDELFYDHEIVALREKFSANTPDAQWINALSSEGRWVVISGDRRITKNRAEFAAFRSSKLVGFFLSKGLYKASIIKQTERLLALWDKIETLAGTVEGGAMFELQIKSNLIRQLRI